MIASITACPGRRKAQRPGGAASPTQLRSARPYWAAKTNGMVTGVEPEEGGNRQDLIREAMQLDKPG
jgi:hypothetical protein